MTLAGEFVVELEEAGGEIGRAPVLEVHGEERDVGEDVAAAELVREVEAVQHTRAVGEAEDVVSQEVAVPVADPPVCHPLFEEPGPALHVARGACRYFVERVGGQDPAAEGLEFGDVAGELGRDHPRGSGGRGRRGPGRGRVERRQQPRQLAEVVVGRFACGHQGRQAAVGGHPPHHDEVVAGCTVDVEDIGDAEVHVGGEATVERDLPVGRLLASLPGREVEEVELHRLLQLVRAVAGEHHDRGMCLRQRRPTARRLTAPRNRRGSGASGVASVAAWRRPRPHRPATPRRGCSRAR